MATVTFDLWHTLVFLSPDDEDAYSRTQVALAVDALRGQEPLPGVPRPSDELLAREFEHVLAEAAAAADQGRTVTLEEQIVRAGHRTGSRPDVGLYRRRLADAVHRQPWRLAPGAVETLTEVSQMGHKVGVISNTVGEEGSAFRPWLDRVGLARCVDAWTFSNELPWTKPAPEIFHFALERLGGSPGSTVHVGDGWADIEGARRAGLRGSVLFTGLQEYGERYRALHVRAGRAIPAADRSIVRLSELPPLLPGLLPV